MQNNSVDSHSCYLYKHALSRSTSLVPHLHLQSVILSVDIKKASNILTAFLESYDQ